MKKQYLLTILIFIFTYQLTGQMFNEHHVITSGSMPAHANSINIVSLNNDGEQDVLACSNLGIYIYFLENKGNQEFDVIKEFEYDLYELNKVSSSDINNDGLFDIVYSRYDYSGQLAWKKNIGNNEFSIGGTLFDVPSSGWRTVSFKLIDLNGDNVDDIIISSTTNDGQIKLFYRINRGNGIFNPVVSLLDTGEVVKFDCHDIDIDGDNDIIYILKNPYKLVIAINNGTGEFNEEVIIDTNYHDPVYEIQIFDTDIDNDIDIMGFTINDSIALFLNNGGNVFTKNVSPKDSLFIPDNVKKLDFDNDGDFDLINHYMVILENIGNNTFQFQIDFDFPFPISDLQICDMNNNGDEDIVFGYSSGAIGYIEDASIDNFENWRTLTSQLIAPRYPAYKMINDDEYPDICILDYFYNYVFYLNNGEGGFTDTLTIDRLHNHSGKSIFYDINNDGYCDIISYSDYESSVSNDSSHFKIAKNNGDNTFTKTYIDDFNNLQRKHTDFIDYNNDNILNAVLINSNNNNDSIYFFNVNPDFTISSYDTIVCNLPYKILNYKFYDIDKNGQNDIIINDEHTLYVNYSINNRFDNDFDTIIHSDDKIYDFEIANIKNDTTCDILYVTTYYIGVLENFDGSSFNGPYNIEMDNFPRLIVSNDLNLDGVDEIICVSINNISVIQDIENGSYSIEEYNYNGYAGNYYYVGNNYNENPFIFTDVDLDGDDDLLCTNFNRSDLSWFENSFIDTIDYTSFPENNAVWTEQNGIFEGNPPETWTSLYVTESDTILLGNSYTNIYEYYLNPQNFDTIRQLYASIRQDKLEKRVYIIRHYLTESNEKLLLDFKANAGDTIILAAYYWDLDPIGTDSVFVVDSIKTTTVYNFEEREIQYLSNHNEQTPVSLSIIEGVGSIQNPFGPVTNMVNKTQREITELCCPDYLICLSIDDELVYVLDDESSCSSLEVWSSIEAQNENKIFRIYPNPAKDNLNIRFDESISSEFEILIYNIQGKLVSQLYQNRNKFTIDLSGYKPGVYLFKVIYDDILYSSRFIIVE